MNRTNDMLFRLIEAYTRHAAGLSNPIVAEIAQMVVDVDITMMWMLTQG